MSVWGDDDAEDVSGELDGVETGQGVSNAGNDADYRPPVSDVDINTMSTEDFMALSDAQFMIVLAQMMGELNVVQRRRTELSPFYYEYKALQERERNLSAQKSACQSILRSARG